MMSGPKTLLRQRWQRWWDARLPRVDQLRGKQNLIAQHTFGV